MKASLEKLDFLVLQDIFLTETSPYADVVFPGACFAEKDGTFTSGERRINRVRKAVNPPGEAKADWEIFTLLANKMGLKGFDFKSAKDVWDDMRAVTPSMFGATYEKMEKPESVHWPCPTEEHPGTPILHKEKFAAADGLGTFFGIEYRPPAEVADKEYPYHPDDRAFDIPLPYADTDGESKVLDYEVPESYIQINTPDAEISIKQ